MARPTALLLTGGGARAAYQVGVPKAVAELYPATSASLPHFVRHLGGGSQHHGAGVPRLLFPSGVRKLEWVWRRSETHHIFDFHPCQLLWRTLYQGSAGLITPRATGPFTCLTTPPAPSAGSVIDHHRIDDNILYGSLEAIAITASDYDDGLHHLLPGAGRTSALGARQTTWPAYPAHLGSSAGLPALPLSLPATPSAIEFMGMVPSTS